MSHAFMADAMQKSQYRNQVWYTTYLMKILEDAKEKRVRNVDKSIQRADTLQKILSAPAAKPIPVPLREIIKKEDDSMMMEVEPEILDIFYKSTEKGGDERYLKARNRKAPDDKNLGFILRQSGDFHNIGSIKVLYNALVRRRLESGAMIWSPHEKKYISMVEKMQNKYYFRLTTSWDYGWQQKQSRQRARDVNFGRKAILKETFYRKNNLAPDPKHYSEPSGGEVGICSEYTCM